MITRLLAVLFFCYACGEPTAQTITPSAGKPRSPISIESSVSHLRGGRLQILVAATASESIDNGIFELRGTRQRFQKSALQPGKTIDMEFILPEKPDENPVLDVALYTGGVQYKSSHEVLIRERDEIKNPELKKGHRQIKEL